MTNDIITVVVNGKEFLVREALSPLSYHRKFEVVRQRNVNKRTNQHIYDVLKEITISDESIAKRGLEFWLTNAIEKGNLL